MSAGEETFCFKYNSPNWAPSKKVPPMVLRRCVRGSKKVSPMVLRRRLLSSKKGAFPSKRVWCLALAWAHLEAAIDPQ